MTIKDAEWEPAAMPKATLGLWFTELAGWIAKGHVAYRVLLASNGKIYRVSHRLNVTNPAEWTWEGYTT